MTKVKPRGRRMTEKGLRSVEMTGGGFFDAVQNSTFYILHFTFKKRSFDSLRSLRMTEKGLRSSG